MKRKSAIAGLVVVLAAFVGAIGCGGSKSSGGGSASPMPQGDAGSSSPCDGGCVDVVDPGHASDSSMTAPVESCMECEGKATACSAALNTCANNASCLALTMCIDQCGNTTCMQQCQTSNTAGLTDYEAFANCLCSAANCGAACAGECTGQTGPDAGAGCNSCEIMATSMGGACFSPSSACNASAACVKLLQCLDGCPVGDSSCESNCDAENPGGASDVQAVDTCLCGANACGTQCATQCGG